MSDCRYPEGEWRADLRSKVGMPVTYLPQDWSKWVRLDPPPRSDECTAVQACRADRTPERCQEIVVEAQGWFGAVMGVMSVLGSSNPFTAKKIATISMLAAASEDAEIVTYSLKWNYARGRPRHCCSETGIAPMFRGSKDDPLHAAYPAGHAVQTQLAALFLAELSRADVALRDGLFAAAARTAENRMVAGLHFPSDLQAGQALALQLHKLFMSNPSFVAQRYARAAREWP